MFPGNVTQIYEAVNFIVLIDKSASDASGLHIVGICGISKTILASVFYLLLFKVDYHKDIPRLHAPLANIKDLSKDLQHKGSTTVMHIMTSNSRGLLLFDSRCHKHSHFSTPSFSKSWLLHSRHAKYSMKTVLVESIWFGNGF